MGSLSKQMRPTAEFFLIRSGCHLYAFCKVWCVEDMEGIAIFEVVSFSFSKITTQLHKCQLLTSPIKIINKQHTNTELNKYAKHNSQYLFTQWLQVIQCFNISLLSLCMN